MPTIQPYGTWSSALSPKMLSDALRLMDVQWDDATGALLWYEGRGARGVLVAQIGTDAPRDLTGSDLSVRGGVGYGGGDFTVMGGNAYFVAGGRLYKLALAGGRAKAITPAFGDYAAPRLSADGKWLVYVHSYEGVDRLAVVDSAGATWPRVFASGTDFVMQPTWHPNGSLLAYVAWNHPNMPWDGTELRLAQIAYDPSGAPYCASWQTMAGDADTAIFNPQFSPDGRFLAYASDQTGWNQLYVLDLESRAHTRLTYYEADHATPAWTQGMHTFAWSPDSQSLFYFRNEQGFSRLMQVNRAGGEPLVIETPYTDLSQYLSVAVDGRLAFVGSSSRIPTRVVSMQPLATHTTETSRGAGLPRPQGLIHRRATGETLPTEQLAEAQAVSWKGHDGGTAYGLYYAPLNPAFSSDGKPPLMVIVHGGPTSQVRANYLNDAQFFATRGYAVLYPNHRGSTGYGRAYMNKLRGAWGVYDVEDSASGAEYLAAQGLVDLNKIVILGGSAGGYSVLQSLVDKPGFYKAGVCLYGVSNQFALAADTHKFEARYSDQLLGPLPQAADLYRARSPLFHAERIVDPLIVFQGEDDKVVPRDQSDTIVASLKARNVPHEYHVYAGEGHGWRKPETIEHYYKAVMSFLKTWVIYA